MTTLVAGKKGLLMLRRVAAALVPLLAVAALVAVPLPAAAATTDLVINEVESDGDTTDWVELYNTGASDVDASGLRLTDNNLTRTFTIAGGTIVAPGGFVAIDVSVGTGNFGLGGADEIHLFDGSTDIDNYSWTEHSATTYAACPDGSNDFTVSAEPTKGAANACGANPADVLVINEIETDGGTPSDWVELHNTGLVAVDAAGLVIRDNDDTHGFVIPSDTLIAAGGFAAFDVDTGSTAFGLSGNDSARLFDVDGTTEIDSHTWTGGHTVPTLGRCPDGSGDFAATATSTKAAANDCVLPGGAGDVSINEVESDDPADGPDWIELFNAGASDVDISGFVIADNGAGELLPAATVVPAGGYLVLENDVHFTFGLGNGDEVHLYLADGVSVVDEMSYDAHADTTFGRCPDGTGPFVTTAGATKGAANSCAADPAESLVINEIESSDAASGPDWVELFNTALVPVDASGLLIKDSGEGNTLTIAADSIVPAGGFLAVDTSGLGGGDSARLFDGATLIDSYTWTEAADETYGRCPDGVGEFFDTDAATKGAANDCPAPDGYENVVINEVESSGGTPADWVEFYNTGETPVDMSLWVIHDSEDDHTRIIPGGTTIAAHGFVTIDVDVPGGFGLGNDDRVRLYLADGSTLVDERIWGPTHAVTTFGLCPDGTGDLVATFASTKGAPNDCSPVRINEVESSGGTPVDWIELTNASDSSVDISGYTVKDNDDTHSVTVPAATVLAPGAFFALDVDVEGGFGFGGADSARLFDGDTLLDSYSWTEHAATTYARCPDATGEFAVSAAATKAAANECAGIVPAEAWPGAEAVTTVDVATYFGEDMSGLAYEGTGSSTRGVLWAVNNGTGTLFKLLWNGSAWTPAPSDWANGKTLTYPGGTGSVDAEGVGIAGSSGDGVYVASERNNDASGVSRPSVLRYDVTSAGASLVATHEWNLASILPSGIGNNTGLEGIAWVPDSFLVGEGMLDESTSALYDPADYPTHGSGLFFVGVEATGGVYAVALGTDGTASLVATIDPGLTVAAEVSFDASTGLLWAVCDDACAGRTATLEIAQSGPFDGTFQITHAYDNPVGMLDSIANEGFAVSPQELCVDDSKPVFYADDAGTDGHALREASLDCVSDETPVEPGAPSEDDLTPTTQNGVTGPASARPGQTITITVGTDLTGDSVDVWLFSEPVHLGTPTVSTAGTVAAVIPLTTTTGMHRVAVTDANGDVLGWFGITIEAAALASTGSVVPPVAPLAAVLLAGGLLLMLLRRRVA